MPDSPGIYFFLAPLRHARGGTGRWEGPRKNILYIGRATSLKDRVKSYFNKDIAETRGPLIEKMLTEANDIDFVKTDSVLEAIILEANLIKKHQPKYNVKEKSDKSFNYVVITDEDFPRILLIRGKELSNTKTINLKSKILNLKSVFGPFPHGSLLREALKIIRKIFSFRDICIPPHKKHTNKLENVGVLLYVKIKKNKPCFNRQIGLCPGVCTGDISKKEYQKTIRNIKLLFEGKKKILVKKLTAEMKKMARKREFESAAKIRNILFSLKHIQDVSLITKPQTRAEQAQNDAEETLFRIEGYDVAHLSGSNSVGVMVVIEDGEAQKSEYRKFNIKNEKKGSDTHALVEIIERRLAHAEWQLPKLIVVDGGKAQMNVVGQIFKKYGIEIPIVGVVKDEHHRPKNILGSKNLIQTHEKEILLANSEAHRFAIALHRKKRKVAL